MAKYYEKSGENQQKNQPVSVSVIICAYTEERWNDLVEAVGSIENQTVTPKELILVIDHNRRLYDRARETFPGALVIENREEKGLSGARNTGIAAASGEVLAFMDEDALADPGWLERIWEGYADPAVMGVGGAIEPLWLAGRPRWFPEEFDWVVGCTYRGMPKTSAPVRNLIVRNLIGANMSIRRDLLAALGGFRTGLGRVNTLPLGCEETELCIRALQRWPGRKFLYNPAARVRHRVPAKRGRLRYFASRCFAEGISKAAVSRLVGAGDGLASERQYTMKTLPVGALRGIKDAVSGKLAGLGRSAAIVTGLGVTGMGYAAGMVSYKVRRADLTPQPPSLQGKGEQEHRQSPVGAEVTPSLSGKGPGVRSYAYPIPSTGSRRLKILMVTPQFFPHTGGVENHVYEVSRRLAKLNADVTVLTTDPSGKLPESERMDGFRVLRARAWPEQGDFYFAPGIYNTVRQGGWDLVHIQSYHTFVPPVALAAALRARIPYVVTFHGGGHSSALRNRVRRTQRALLGPFLRRARRLVAVAEFEIKQYGVELNIPPERFALIPNGSDLPAAQPASPGTERGECLIASVGRLERYKGHHRLIAAMPDILKKIPTARLWIAGSGPEEARLKSQIEQLGLQEHVEIRPIPSADRQAMANELSKADLFVLLSEFETHPIAVLEAVSLGVPALVADTSGLSELAEKGLAQSIVLDSSPEQVAQAVTGLLQNPQRPPEVDLPTWDDCARELFDLYQEIIGSFIGESESHANFVTNPNISPGLRRD